MDTANFLSGLPTLIARTDHVDLCPEIQGFTSPKVQSLLRYAYSLIPTDEAYAELGALFGKTFVSTLGGGKQAHNYIFDNFSQFGGNKEVLTTNITKFLGEINYALFDGDFRDTMPAIADLPKIAVYFMDGPHEFADQRDAITYAEPLLADKAIIIVDDWNYEPVKPGVSAGTNKFPGKFKLVKELPAKFNGDLDEWWDGIGIIIYDRFAVPTANKEQAKKVVKK